MMYFVEVAWHLYPDGYLDVVLETHNLSERQEKTVRHENLCFFLLSCRVFHKNNIVISFWHLFDNRLHLFCQFLFWKDSSRSRRNNFFLQQMCAMTTEKLACQAYLFDTRDCPNNIPNVVWSNYLVDPLLAGNVQWFDKKNIFAQL